MRACVFLALCVVACGDSSGGAHGEAFDGGPSSEAPDASFVDASSEGASGDVDAGPLVFPDRLGAAWDEGGRALRFRVWSSRATRIEVWLYDVARGSAERMHAPLVKEPASDVWSVVVDAGALAAASLAGHDVFYGYRAWGPNWDYDATWTPGSSAGWTSDVDASGNRFDPNKLLLDPYARETSHDPSTPGSTDGSVYAVDANDRAKDSAPAAPKGIALRPDATDVGARPTRSFKDDLVYEVHVRGLTMSDPSVPADARGTYRGAAMKAAYLADLGVTAIELLPVQETQNETNDLAAQASTTSGMNYWGYSTLAFFAPDRRYSSDKTPGGPTREMKAMVKAFHDAGIKVFLDVVYNHTGEGKRLLSWRGLDNAAYYELSADAQSNVDNTGTGANVNAASPVVRDMVIDSLAHWSKEMGADGFRFDLAAVLGNTCASACFQYDAGDAKGILARAVAELPGLPLIAEPWGIGSGTYQLGHFPAGWSEWNGSFRDTIREAQNKLGVDALTPSQIATRLGGSGDLFSPATRAPWASVNYVDCHDGFTLRDVYTYDTKSNAQAFPFGPSSGGDDNNNSWSQNGDAAAQHEAARTGLSLAVLAAGVPMIAGGDEMYRTQYGNNNAYNLDTSKNWLDWSLATSESAFAAYARGLFRFRAAHPALRPAAFWTGKDHDGNGVKDSTWLTAAGTETSAAYFGDSSQHFLATRIDGSEGGDTVDSIYVAYNAGTTAVTATLPTTAKAWWLAGDSNASTFVEAGNEARITGASVVVAARSVVVLVER